MRLTLPRMAWTLALLFALPVLAGCQAHADDRRVLTAADLPCADSDPTTGLWESAPWHPGSRPECTWVRYEGRLTLQVQHPLGRVPKEILVYLSFAPDGTGGALTAGDTAHVGDVTDTSVTISERDRRELLRAARPAMTDAVRLGLSVDAERATGMLRLAAGIAVGIGAVWLAALRPDAVGWIVVVVACLASLGWVLAYQRSRRRIAEASRWYLALDALGLEIAKGGNPLTIAWTDVTQMRVDENRLNIVLERRDGPRVVIEPMWADLGVYDLLETLASRRPALPVGRPRDHD